MALGGGVYSSQNKRLGGSYINFQSNEERSVNLITKAINENGTYLASDDDADGYLSVIVEVTPNVESKEITENGTYNASDEGLDGYESVTVNVPSGSGVISGVDFTTDTLPVTDVSFYGTSGAVYQGFTPSSSGLSDYQGVSNVDVKCWMNANMSINNTFNIRFGDIETNNYSGQIVSLRDRIQNDCIIINTTTSGSLSLNILNGGFESLPISLSALKNATLSFSFDYDASDINGTNMPFVSSGNAEVVVYLNGQEVTRRAYGNGLYVHDFSYIPNCIYFKKIDDALASGSWKPQIMSVSCEIK